MYIFVCQYLESAEDNSIMNINMQHMQVMQGKCIYQFNPEVRGHCMTAEEITNTRRSKLYNLPILEEKQEKTAGNVIDLDFGMQSIFHLHLLLFLINSYGVIFLFLNNFSLFLHVFSQSSFLFLFQ